MYKVDWGFKLLPAKTHPAFDNRFENLCVSKSRQIDEEEELRGATGAKVARQGNENHHSIQGDVCGMGSKVLQSTAWHLIGLDVG